MHPRSLIRVFTERMKKLWALTIHRAHSEDSSDCADAQADLRLHRVHMLFLSLAVSRLIIIHLELPKC